MNRPKPYLNRLIKLKQQQIQDTSLCRKLQQIKPLTKKHKQHSQVTMNHGKREMLRQDRETQIERDNQFLLQKITKVMTKKSEYPTIKIKKSNTKANKSLNEIYRKHQLEEIQLENRRLLQKLQNKRSSLNIEQWERDWQVNKSTCKRIANVGFHTTNIKSSIRIRSLKNKSTLIKYQKMKLAKQIMIDGYNFQVKMEFVEDRLKIVSRLQDSEQIKIIEIPKDEAIICIDKQCKGSLDRLAQKLHYDAEQHIIYIASSYLQEDNNQQLDFNPQINQFTRGFEPESKSLQKKQDPLIEKSNHNYEVLQKRELSTQCMETQINLVQTQPNRANINDQREIETIKEQSELNLNETELDHKQNQDKEDSISHTLKLKPIEKSKDLAQTSAFIAPAKQINSPSTQLVTQSREINKQIVIAPQSVEDYNQYQSDFVTQTKENHNELPKGGTIS